MAELSHIWRSGKRNLLNSDMCQMLIILLYNHDKKEVLKCTLLSSNYTSKAFLLVLVLKVVVCTLSSVTSAAFPITSFLDGQLPLPSVITMKTLRLPNEF